jgi:coniferyl-aldehyde dehydrogenase
LHPKGVVLIISPWNYPVLLSLLPMASALAAGNRVILKPSECSPKTSQVLVNIVQGSLPQDRATVLTGGADIAIELCEQPFDHIMFTGSTRVGRMVMQTAAKNLTPVTLELGGKSPAIVHEDYDLEKAATRIARGKLLNAGQTCVAPDYVLLPRQIIPNFIAAYKQVVARFYPDIANNADYTSIISRAQFDRLMALLKDAKDKGAEVSIVGTEGVAYSGKRKLHPHIVEQIDESMQIAHEEIFGPILPIIPYDNLEQASAYINQRPRPLALYYFDHDLARVDKFLNATISGGAAVNASIVHVAQDDQPSGGTGDSGMGVSHGFEGFKEFSHTKSVFYQAKLNGIALLDPPYSKMFDRIAKFLLR